MDIAKKDLLRLPHKKLYKIKTYDSLLVFKTGKKHDSGYACMWVIGLFNSQSLKGEIISSYSDDLKWKTNGLDFSSDMLYPSGIIHFWSDEASFEVSDRTSTLKINLKLKKINSKHC